MGNRQSSLHIYLGKKEGKYEIPGHYDVKITTAYSKTCCNFFWVSYRINYVNKLIKDIILRYGYYNLTLCLGKSVDDVGEKVFDFHPQHYKHVLRIVTVFYSVLHPETPLFVIFRTRKGEFNFLYDNIRSKQFAYSSDLKDLIYKDGLHKGLIQEFNKLFGSHKLELISSSSEKQEFESSKQNVGDGSKFSKIIFTSKVAKATVGISELLSPIPRGLTKNLLDSYYLSNFKNKQYHGILVYYSVKDIVLALEFDTDCNTKKHIVKQDKYGTHWEEKTLTFDKDEKLSSELASIESTSSGNEIVTFILDLQDPYNEVTVSKVTEKLTYYFYFTHKNNGLYSIKKSRLVMTKKEFKQDGLSETTVYDQISVYYLKHKDKGPDKDPFLIKFTEKPSTEKSYYFEKEFNVSKCHEIKYSTEVLNKRLEQLEQEGNCAKELEDLRETACKILSREETTPKEPAPTTPKEPAPTTPKEVPPPDIKLIAGSTAGAVGGTAVLGAGGYGYYLYATTIKLLT